MTTNRANLARHIPTPNPAAAAAWWHRNRAAIVAALPLTIGPKTYNVAFPACMDRWVAQSDTLPPPMAEAYICRPLRQLREHPARWGQSTPFDGNP